jgi:hypothetical protein
MPITVETKLTVPVSSTAIGPLTELLQSLRDSGVPDDAVVSVDSQLTITITSESLAQDAEKAKPLRGRR